MNADEVLGIEYAVFILEESRDKLDRSIAATDRFRGVGIWSPQSHDKMSAYLARCVNYLRREILTAVHNDLAERVLNSGIVAVHEVSIHELHGERRFA